MNGVRRFLGGNSTPPSIDVPLSYSLSPAIHPNGRSWPPESPAPEIETSPKTTTGLFLRKQRPDDDNPTPSPSRSLKSLPSASSSSPRMNQPSRVVTRKSVTQEPSKRISGLLNTKDELLISLLASEAVVDSREFQILSSEEVDELKKEHQVLTARLGAMTKKLSLETKIRDAAVSLNKVNAANKKLSKKTEDQLEAANNRVDTAQRELWRVSDRANIVHRKLLEHRAGVLSFSVRSMEKKMAPSNGRAEDSGYNTPNRGSTPLRSPTASSVASGSGSASTPRFDGAHLFAGHVDAVVPKRLRSSSVAHNEITSLQERLRVATSTLAEASKKQAQMTRDLSVLQLEKQEVETMMGMELQNAEETIAALENELPRFEALESQLQSLLIEKTNWERDRSLLADRNEEVQSLKRNLEDGETQRGQSVGSEQLFAEATDDYRRQLEQKDREISELKSRWEQDRTAWDLEKMTMENQQAMQLSTLQTGLETKRREAQLSSQKASEELEDGLKEMQLLIQNHNIMLFTRDTSLPSLLSSVGSHLDGMESKLQAFSQAEQEWDTLRRKLEDDVRAGLDRREAMAREVEDARREREEARREARSLEGRVKSQESDMSGLRSPIIRSFPSSMEGGGDAAKYIALLQPVWAILPSPDTRAAKFGGAQRGFRAGSPGPGNNPSSLSELDVRSLKTLYDSRNAVGSPNPGAFSIEAFVVRVQALIADDRALIERLVRFAQAHDLLKKNAERAQKLAQEGNVALETYQKQVRTLEDRNMSMASKQAAMQDQVQQLQDAIERISAEKRDVEMLAAEQAETCRQLTDANNTLSARTLTLAEEVVTVPERIKRELEGQLAECKAALTAAQDEVDAMRMSEQSQRIALLDELNSMQTENGVLRQQLRAIKK